MCATSISKRPTATISVVIPTYKHANHILETLNTVFGQTYSPAEIIVVNDGSPDDTENILLPLISAKRITYISQANKGQATARNVGIEASTSEFVALLDDDDLWPPDKLERQIHAMRDSPEAVLCYGDVCPFQNPCELPDGLNVDGCAQTEVHPPTGDVLRHFMRRNWIVTPGQTLIKRSAILAVKGFDAGIWGCDDYDLYIRLARRGQFIYVNRTALFYRRHNANASRNIELMYKNNKAVQSKNFGPIPQLTKPFLWISANWHLRHYFFERFVMEAKKSSSAADFGRERHLLLRAIQIYPMGIVRRTYLKSLYQSIFRHSPNENC